jgi:predicted ester cyclase
MTLEENKQVVRTFVEVVQDGHDLAFADQVFHRDFVNHYAPEGRASLPGESAVEHFRRFYGMLLAAFPDASMRIDEQIAERDLVATRKTLRGTHRGELWGIPPTGRTVEWEFVDIFRVRDGQLAEHWTHMDFEELRSQLRDRPDG